MAFADLLKAPLPSKAQNVNEGVEDELGAPAMTPPEDVCPDCGHSPCVCDDAHHEEMHPDESDHWHDEEGNHHHYDDQEYDHSHDDDTSTELSPEESQGVDDTMNAVATPLLLQDELSEDEIKEFVESVDADVAVAEGFLTEKTIIKFDKNAKRAQLYEVAVAACAREKNDPLYRKLETVYKMERVLKAKLRRKYNSQAQKKVKEYLARAKKSKSGIIARIARKITGKG